MIKRRGGKDKIKQVEEQILHLFFYGGLMREGV